MDTLSLVLIAGGSGKGEDYAPLRRRIEAETGLGTGFEPLGFIELAADKDRLEEYRRVAAFNRFHGNEVIEAGYTRFFDKLPLRWGSGQGEAIKATGARVVPPAPGRAVLAGRDESVHEGPDPGPGRFASGGWPKSRGEASAAPPSTLTV